jgi:hypothetical protein
VRIVGFSVKNYKSFSASHEATGTLSPGINVIVGQNNVGKTALLEALTLRAGNVPHRSLETHPVRDAVVTTQPSVTLDVSISQNEWRSLVADHGGQFVLEIGPQGNMHPAVQALDQAFRPEGIIHITRDSQGIRGEIVGYSLRGNPAYFDLHRPDLEPVSSSGDRNTSRPLGNLLASAVTQRMYLFNAERFGLGEGPVGYQSRLQPNAANLPEVLSQLQSNLALHQEFNALVNRVLPSVRGVSVENTQRRMVV